MQWLSQLVFGLLQGLTEVWPVSSSAHTAIGNAFWKDFTTQSPVAFTTSIFLHFGTALAILAFYWPDLLKLSRSALRTATQWPLALKKSVTSKHPFGQRAPFYFALSLMVTFAIGWFLRDWAESVFDHPAWAAVFLAVNGLFLMAATIYVGKNPSSKRQIADLSLAHFVVIGIAQGLAVLPGVSRFGMTLGIGLFCGLAWLHALKLSFMLSVPVVLAAAGLELHREWTGLTWQSLPPAVFGIVTAGLTAGAAIWVIRREELHAPKALATFAWYCLAASPFYVLYLWLLAS
jgi:undecaprenyl-diphosphatase